MIKTEKEVEEFLRQFKPKFNVWGIIFLNREKNLEALKILGITPQAREEVIRKIEADDYIETIIDNESFGEMWVFGQDYDGLCNLVHILNDLHGKTQNTMITVTHDVRCAEALCDRSFWISNGTIEKYGGKELIREYFLETQK